MATPSEIIVTFIRKQPEQIRDSISIAFVMMSGVDVLTLEPGDAFHKVAYDLIGSGVGIGKVIVAASAIGIIDYYFEKPEISVGDVAAMAQSTGSTTLQSVARKMQLTNAFNERARTEWKGLRQSSLSFEALNKYEPTLLTSSFPKAT